MSAAPFAPHGPGDYGAFSTPVRTAAYMVGLLKVERGDRVLDPCAGEGAFVAALLAAGVRARQITAWELDRRAATALRRRFPGVRVITRDALLGDDLDPADRFDRIVANPPYLNKASAYVRAHRVALRRRFAHVGSGETFAMFLETGLRRLAPGGRLVFIVSDTLRTLGTHERLRRMILQDHSLASLTATRPRLFTGAAVRTVILEIDSERGRRATAVLAATASEDYAGGRWTTIPTRAFAAIDGAPFVLEAPASVLRLFAQPGRLTDAVTGHIGMHTRDNARSLAICPERIPTGHLHRGSDRRVIAAAAARLPRWQPYLKEGGDKDFCFPIFEYVDWRPAARSRYVIPRGDGFLRAGICVSGVSQRLSARVMAAGCYWDTNKVIGLIPVRERDTMLLLGLLNSDLYNYLAKRLLNATPSLQLRDLWRLPLPEIAPAAARRIAALAAACVRERRADPRADVTGPRRRLDDAVYAAMGVSAADRRVVERALA